MNYLRLFSISGCQDVANATVVLRRGGSFRLCHGTLCRVGASHIETRTSLLGSARRLRAATSLLLGEHRLQVGDQVDLGTREGDRLPCSRVRGDVTHNRLSSIEAALVSLEVFDLTN